MTTAPTIHGTSVLFCGQGILLRGPSGAGKSDLTLRIIDAGGTLVADDRSVVFVENKELYLSPPEATKGLIEIRSIGIRRVPYIEKVKLTICLDCVSMKELTRIPKRDEIRFHTIPVPLYKIYPFEVSAVAKIRALLQTSPANSNDE
jgi:serine kinase of HPr protein (carbohydrate metabolism regulator)